MDGHRRNERASVPGFQHSLADHERTAKGRVDVIPENVLGDSGIGEVGALEHLDEVGIRVGDGELMLLSEVSHPLAVGDHDVVVGDPSLHGEGGCSGDVVVGRRLDGGDAGLRKVLLERLVDVAIAVEVRLIGGLGGGFVAAVIHTEHDGDDGGFVGIDVAGEAGIDVSAASARDAVAAPPGVGEADLQAWIASDNVGFDHHGVVPLVGDAVAIEEHLIVIVQIKALILREGAG